MDHRERPLIGPNLDRNSITPITPSDLIEFDLLNDGAAARRVTARAQYIDTAWERTFAEMGLLAEYVERRQLWTHVGCGSQNEWITRFCPRSRSTWFDAKRRWKELADVLPDDKIQMSRGNLIVMQKLSTAVRRDPEVIEAAKALPEAAFRAKLEVEYPNQHIESVKPMHLKPEQSQAKVIEYAIEIAMALDDCRTREEAIEDIAEFFVSERAVEYERTKTA